MHRQYTPNVGDIIKLKDMLAYNTHEISMWAWLKVEYVYTSGMVGHVNVRVLNGSEPTEQTAVVKLSDLSKPIGWKPVYTITCENEEQARRVRDDWFKRGINVWASHDLSSAGNMAFTPVEKPSVLTDAGIVEGTPKSPHWQYTGDPVETIKAEDCEKYFRVEVLHQWVPDLPPTSEKTARRKAIKVVRAEKGVELHFVPDGCGGKMPLCERIETLHAPPEEEANAEV